MNISKAVVVAILTIILTSPSIQAQDCLSYFNRAQIESANTAQNANYLTEKEKEIYLWVNLARMYPQEFAEMFKAYAFEHGLKGSSYAKSLYKTLMQSEPAKPYQPSQELYDLAKCHAKHAGQMGYVGHERDKTLCQKGYFAECCSYGVSTARGIVFQLLIDEGVPSLGHRINCLNPTHEKLGVSVQPHSTYGTNAVLDMI